MYMQKNPHVIRKKFLNWVFPILGICYGSQLMAYTLGGTVETAPVSEYGKTEVKVDKSSLLFERCRRKDNLLDEPHRLYRKGTGRLYYHVRRHLSAR